VSRDAPDPTRRIAMWSGPRTISTAMLRSWGNRADTAVTDEPLYATYLAATGLDHPGRDAILSAQPTDWREVVAQLLGAAPDGAPIWYVKHMAHHLLPDMDRGWLARVANAFLLRDPRSLLASYARVRGEPTLDDLGLAQQVELFALVRETTGAIPPVIDSDDVLADPRGVLGVLCEALHVPFDEAMLAWAAGPRDTDGVWAPHWYAAVERSTGFAAPHTEPVAVPAGLEDLLDACMDRYRLLHVHRLTA
jgi:hypothetical protein